MVDSAYGIFNPIALFNVFMDFNVLNRVCVCACVCVHACIYMYVHAHASSCTVITIMYCTL